MRKFLTTHHLIILALLEDILFLSLFTVILVSVAEIILPGIISSKVTIAFFFTFLGLFSFLYFFVLKHFNISRTVPAVSKKVLLPLLTLGIIILFFFLRAFGFLGASIQILLLLTLLVFLLKERSFFTKR